MVIGLPHIQECPAIHTCLLYMIYVLFSIMFLCGLILQGFQPFSIQAVGVDAYRRLFLFWFPAIPLAVQAAAYGVSGNYSKTMVFYYAVVFLFLNKYMDKTYISIIYTEKEGKLFKEIKTKH